MRLPSFLPKWSYGLWAAGLIRGAPPRLRTSHCWRKESRAWTVVAAKAPAAAGVIHTDFERGFIAAEVCSYGDMVEAGSKAAARDVGKLRIEGKEYEVQDGDVIEFRFNV